MLLCVELAGASPRVVKLPFLHVTKSPNARSVHARFKCRAALPPRGARGLGEKNVSRCQTPPAELQFRTPPSIPAHSSTCALAPGLALRFSGVTSMPAFSARQSLPAGHVLALVQHRLCEGGVTFSGRPWCYIGRKGGVTFSGRPWCYIGRKGQNGSVISKTVEQ